MDHTSVKREPMLNDSEAFNIGQSKAVGQFLTMSDIAKNVRDFYEDRITDGTLMVVKTAWIVQVPFIAREGSTIAGCSVCGKPGLSSIDPFCPGCGARIIE